MVFMAVHQTNQHRDSITVLPFAVISVLGSQKQKNVTVRRKNIGVPNVCTRSRKE
jgi:hypothetical protein